MVHTQAALADRQRQRLGMAAAVLAALATMVALATGNAKADSDVRSSHGMSGGRGQVSRDIAPDAH